MRLRMILFWQGLVKLAKFVSLQDAVLDVMTDGLCVALEGFTHLIPHASAHEIIRKGFKNLTLVRMTPDIIYDQMIGMGCASKLIFSYAGNPGVGLLRRLRDAVENQWPVPLEIEEHSHAAMANAYEAGAASMPCALFKGYLGAELRQVNPNIKMIFCPFTGEELAVVPSIRPDVSFIHAQKADRKGNVLIEGIIGVQKEAVLSAAKSVVTVEEIIEDFETHPNAVILPHWTIDYIAEVPGAAHPSYAQGYYARDNAAYKEWDTISANRELYLKWMAEHVMQQTPDVFAERVRFTNPQSK